MVKNPPTDARDARDTGLISGSGRPLRRENGNPLQYSCLENSTDRGVWQATVLGVTKSQTRLSDIHSLIYLVVTSAPPQIIRHYPGV